MKESERLIQRAIEQEERARYPEEPLRIGVVLEPHTTPESVLPILTYPHEMLRQVAPPLQSITEADKALMERMILTSARLKAFGLAAPQVGEMKRILVITIGGFIQAIVNPIITLKGKRVWSIEGCLSLPGLVVKIPRAEKVIVEGLNMTGRKIALVEEGIIARALQHEVDHLNGVLIIDHVPIRARKKILKTFQQQKGGKVCLEKSIQGSL